MPLHSRQSPIGAGTQKCMAKVVEVLQGLDWNKGKSIDYCSKTSKAVVKIETDTKDEDDMSMHAQENCHLDHNEGSELKDDEEEVLIHLSTKRQSMSEDRQEDSIHILNSLGLSQADNSDQYITMSGDKESEPDDASISGNNDMEPDDTDAVSEQNSEKSSGATPVRILMMDVTNMSSKTVNIGKEKEVKRR
ncbi:hypothetical protein CPB97_005532 [Podila verticillata]|nr:hypothetical protein CPB97_005532 [Podila verticillata]